MWPTRNVASPVTVAAAWLCRWGKLPVANFDNILLATFTLWQISTTELWVNVMYTAISAVGVDQQPQAGYNPALALFFIAFIVFGGEAGRLWGGVGCRIEDTLTQVELCWDSPAIGVCSTFTRNSMPCSGCPVLYYLQASLCCSFLCL